MENTAGGTGNINLDIYNTGSAPSNTYTADK